MPTSGEIRAHNACVAATLPNIRQQCPGDALISLIVRIIPLTGLGNRAFMVTA